MSERRSDASGSRHERSERSERGERREYSERSRDRDERRSERREDRHRDRDRYDDRRERHERRERSEHERPRDDRRERHDRERAHRSRSRSPRRDGPGEPPAAQQGPVFERSGLLAKESNSVNGVALKYHEPPEAQRPKSSWRMFVFKDGKEVGTLPCSPRHARARPAVLLPLWPRPHGRRYPH